ncbi:MAG: glycosyltransferase, partial [Proteobacteria bacterium]|nr:glycosyltransferase [Pseudomonadota bacterium]
VLPDHEEHDAHALLEALATGVASIGARSGIIPEILGDGSGLLVEPGSPDSLAAALSTLAGDEILRDSLGRRGRKKAIESFSLEAIARRKIQVYEDALHDR